MEDYKQKYKNALSQAEQAINNIPDKSLAKWLQSIFPELCDSEDEKIRNAIREAVEHYWSDDIQARTDIFAWLEKQGDWSEEDEEKRIDAIKYLEIFDAQGIHGDVALPCINWLKSLKGRVQPKPKQEWSEEDEKIVSMLVNRCNGTTYTFNNLIKMKSWLKSLKERIGE